MNIEDLPEEAKKQLIETSDFFIEKIDKFIKDLKKIKNELKDEDVKINCNASLKAMALKNCLDEYDFHWDFIVKVMEKKGLIKKSN